MGWLTSRLDSAIRSTFPGWAAKRRSARNYLAVADAIGDERRAVARAFDAARKDRIYGKWNPGQESADASHLEDGQDIVNRARDLERNNPNAAALIEGNVRNVVGCGLRPQARIDPRKAGIAPERARELNRIAEAGFRRWARIADAEEKQDFFGLQRQWQRAKVRDGEQFGILSDIDRPGRSFRLAVQTIERDRIDTPNGFEDSRTRQGVVLGNAGQPVAYFVHVDHPGDGVYQRNPKRRFRKVAKWDGRGGQRVLHLFRVKRYPQTRGISKLAPILTTLHDIGSVLEAERIAKRIESCLGGFITRDPALWETAGDGIDAATGKTVVEFEPGAFEQLAPGENVQLIDPKRPGTTFEPYLRIMLRIIGAAFELPLEVMLLDYSQTNFAAAKAAMNEAKRAWECEQAELADQFCQPCYEAVLEEMWRNGEFDVPDFYGMRDVWTECTWLPDGHRWVDPAKDAKASEISLGNKTTNHQRELAGQGIDWEENLRAEAEFEAREQEIRVEFGLAPKPTPPAAGDEPGDGDEDDDQPPRDSEEEQEQKERELEEATA